MLFKILTLFIASLLPMVSTDWAAAKELVNNDNSLDEDSTNKLRNKELGKV